MGKISYCLWFEDQAEEAAQLYTSVLGMGRIGNVSRYTEVGQQFHGREPGSAMTVDFTLNGQQFVALNGGPTFKFTPALSFFVNCSTVEEVERVWSGISEGGATLMELGEYPFSKRYGWGTDKFGVSWQVIHFEGVPDQRFIPSLLFVGEKCGKAKEAIEFYTGVFNGSKVGAQFPYGPEQPQEQPDHLMYADFELEGSKFTAMDSGLDHDFDFNEAVSIVVTCDTQDEIDHYWNKLSAVPDAEACGWLKDKYGVSWQIVPRQMQELLNSGDDGKIKRVTEAMFQMKKLDIAALEKAGSD